MTRDHPIIFSAPMVRAILDGRKTQTRRILKPQPLEYRRGGLDVGPPQQNDDGVWGQMETVWEWSGGPYREPDREVWHPLRGVRWRPGDRLWVRETFTIQWGGVIYDAAGGQCDKLDDEILYAADYANPRTHRWRPSIHMPRWASRITLLVTAVRVERLQDISEADAAKEGMRESSGGWFEHPVPGITGDRPSARLAFVTLWDHLHGPDAWDKNPWVSVTTFERIEG